MKPSSWDKQLGMVSPPKSAAIQSGQTNHPSKNEVGLDVSHHIHLSLEGKGKYFFLDILFHRMSATTIRQGACIVIGMHHSGIAAFGAGVHSAFSTESG
jgi:hypothetical protein